MERIKALLEKKACDVAINALEEVQQYRAIGTPEECRAAMEKQTGEKPAAVLEFVAAQTTNSSTAEVMCVMETNTAGGAVRN